MREVLFRGKRIDNGGWVEGYYIEDKWGDSNNNQLHFILPHRTCPSILDDWQPIKVIPETVGQYSGLKDKNGVKIFEGDIVKFDNDRHIVYFHNETAEFSTKDIWLWAITDEGLVIGNIHDTEEL